MCVFGKPRTAGLALPLGKLSFGLVRGYAVTLLDLAGQLVAMTGDDAAVIIGEFVPLLLRLARNVFPVALNPVPVHRTVPRLFVDRVRACACAWLKDLGANSNRTATRLVPRG